MPVIRPLHLVRLSALACAALVIAGFEIRASSSSAAHATDEITWRKIVLDREFRSEGVAVADVNRDGKMDVIAGSYWYEAPNWTPHELARPEKFDGEHGYSHCFLCFSVDVNKDGWPDQIVIDFPGSPAFWRENPKGKPGHWPVHPIFHSACNESPAFAQLIRGKKPVLVFPFDESQMAWYEPGKDLSKEWTAHIISEPKAPGTNRFSHGMGVGDVNRDGVLTFSARTATGKLPRTRAQGRGSSCPASSARIARRCMCTM